MTNKPFILISICLLLACTSNDNKMIFIVNENEGLSVKNEFGVNNDVTLIDVLTTNKKPIDVASEYVNWVRDEKNGFIKTKVVGDFTFSLQYKPAAYMALIEAGVEGFSIDSIKNLYTLYNEMEYYELKIEHTKWNEELIKYGTNGMSDYQNRVAYYSFHVNNDIVVKCNTDEKPCLIHHWERNYNAAPNTILQFAFERSNDCEEKIVEYNDRVFGNGILKFRFKKADINKVLS